MLPTSLRADLGAFEAVDGPGVAVGALERFQDKRAFDFDRAWGVGSGGIGFELYVGEVVGLAAGAEFALSVFEEDEFFDASLASLAAMHVADDRDAFAFEVLHGVGHEGAENDVGLHTQIEVVPSDFFGVAGLGNR